MEKTQCIRSLKGSLSRRLPQAGARPYVTQIVDVPRALRLTLRNVFVRVSFAVLD